VGLAFSLAATLVQAGEFPAAPTSAHASLAIVEGRVRGAVSSASRRQTLAEVAALIGFHVRGLELVDEDPASMLFDDLPPEKAIAHILRAQSHLFLARASATAAGMVIVLTKASPSEGAGPSLSPEDAESLMLGSARRAAEMPPGRFDGSAAAGTRGGGAGPGGADSDIGAGVGGAGGGDRGNGAGTPSEDAGDAADADLTGANDGAVQPRGATDRNPSGVPVLTDSAAGDFDGDGTEDLVVTRNGSELVLLRGSDEGLDATSRTSLTTARDGATIAVEALQAGDFDGDGVDDVAAILRSEAAVSLATLRGSRSGFGQNAPRPVPIGDVVGADGIDAARLGVTLASADFDADGYEDLVLGLPGADAGAADAGTIMLLRGGAQGLRMRPAAWRPDLNAFEPRPAKDDHLGSALVAADFDGDGLDDLAVGASGADREAASGAGRVLVFLGAVGGMAPRPARGPVGAGADAQLGGILAAGTIDADGRADLVAIVGAGAHRKAVVFAGIDGGVSRTVMAEAQPAEAGRRPLGNALAVSDFDADGLADLAVASSSPNGAGALTVFTGMADGRGTRRTLRGGRRYVLAAGAALVAGDFDTDGFPDLAIGCERPPRSVGVARGGHDGLRDWRLTPTR